MFAAKPPGGRIRELRRSEAERMLYAIRALLAADEAGQLVLAAPQLEFAQRHWTGGDR